jgi:hypothetical protein
MSTTMEILLLQVAIGISAHQILNPLLGEPICISYTDYYCQS